MGELTAFARDAIITGIGAYVLLRAFVGALTVLDNLCWMYLRWDDARMAREQEARR